MLKLLLGSNVFERLVVTRLRKFTFGSEKLVKDDDYRFSAIAFLQEILCLANFS